MAAIENAGDVLRVLRRVRQVRQYEDRPVPAEVTEELLQVARWTGSSRNTQPWHFIAIDDHDTLRAISQLRTPINWLASAPLAIAIVLDGDAELSEAYDEGRVTERVMAAATLLGLGAGIAWFGDAAQEAEGKRLLGIPAERTARAVIAVGWPITSKDPRPNPAQPGRRPTEELVSWNRMGQRRD